MIQTDSSKVLKNTIREKLLAKLKSAAGKGDTFALFLSIDTDGDNALR